MRIHQIDPRNGIKPDCTGIFRPLPYRHEDYFKKFCGETFSVCSQMKNHSPANDLHICRFTLHKTCITKYLCSPDTFLNRITPYFIFLGNSKN